MTPEMRAEMERCPREGTPRPESSAVRAHVPARVLGVRQLLARHLPQRRVRPRDQGALPALRVAHGDTASSAATSARSRRPRRPAVIEDQVHDLLNFEKSTSYNDRQKAALAYAEAITWRLETDDAFWERLHRHFSEPELVELGCFIALTMGQQSWLRLLNIDHHQVMAGTDASMAPGFESAQALATSKASGEYWAKPAAKRDAA